MASLKKKVLAAGMLAIGVCAGSAMAQQQATNGSDEVKVTVGLKLWYNTWETWLDETFGGIRSTTSGHKFAGIPNVAVNYRDFFASYGYFIKRNYNFPEHLLDGDLSVKRSEHDFNVGYWLLRGDAGGRLGLTVGYKQVNQWFDGDFIGQFKDTKKAVTFGFTGSAPIAAGWFLYANGAFGPAREKFFDTKLKGYYASAEGGVAYPIAPGTTITLGYKTQVTDFNVKYAPDNERGRDTTNGFIVGVNYTF